jgi:hypothetical protein
VLGKSWNEHNYYLRSLYAALNLNLGSVDHQHQFALPDRTSGLLRNFHLLSRNARACTKISAIMLDDRKDAKVLEPTVEKFESLPDDESFGKTIQQPSAMGTVTISDLDDIYLVPAPSADPQGMSRFDPDAQCGVKITCRSAEYAKVEENRFHSTLVDV